LFKLLRSSISGDGLSDWNAEEFSLEAYANVEAMKVLVAHVWGASGPHPTSSS